MRYFHSLLKKYNIFAATIGAVTLVKIRKFQISRFQAGPRDAIVVH